VTPHEERAASRDYAFRVYAVDDADEVRLKDLWEAVWRGKWLIGVTALGLALLAVALSFLVTPVYRSWVLVVPTTETMGSSGLAALASQFAGVGALTGFNVGGNTQTAEAVATLRSRAFTVNFIREHDLLPILFADLLDEETRSWKTETGAPPTMWEAFLRFDSIRSVGEDLQTGLFEVEIKWTDPETAARWANGLIEDVNRILRARAIRESRQNLDFLRTELEKNSQVPIQTTIYGLMEAEMKNAMLANVKREYAFRVIDPATVPEFKYWPNRLLFGLLGFFAGAVIGTFVAVLRGSSKRAA
jgi:uncharacterized protein involved in exopolysaccharide biosynthesis